MVVVIAPVPTISTTINAIRRRDIDKTSLSFY
jgi:hypothetical protein